MFKILLSFDYIWTFFQTSDDISKWKKCCLPNALRPRSFFLSRFVMSKASFGLKLVFTPLHQTYPLKDKLYIVFQYFFLSHNSGESWSWSHDKRKTGWHRIRERWSEWSQSSAAEPECWSANYNDWWGLRIILWQCSHLFNTLFCWSWEFLRQNRGTDGPTERKSLSVTHICH